MFQKYSANIEKSQQSSIVARNLIRGNSWFVELRPRRRTGGVSLQAHMKPMKNEQLLLEKNEYIFKTKSKFIFLGVRGKPLLRRKFFKKKMKFFGCGGVGIFKNFYRIENLLKN